MVDLEKALLNPKVYDSKTKDVKLVKSLVNFVFLTDKYVYKIKQPTVRFEGKINYTTLASRKRATFEEYKINKIFSPPVHVGVTPIQVDSHGSIGMDTGGKTIDYALKMKRLPEERELSELIRLGTLRSKDVVLLGNALRKIHTKLPRGRKFARYASPQFLRQRWQENLDWMKEPHMGRVINKSFVQSLAAWYEEHIDSFDSYFAARQFFAQRIHGDLNTENIFYVAGKYYFIDANQLLEEWEYGDPLNDVGAIAKDFDAYGKTGLGLLFVQTYLENMSDDALNTIRFYKMYWATIRYLIYSDILARRPKKEWEKRDVARAKLYRTLVERYLKSL